MPGKRIHVIGTGGTLGQKYDLAKDTRDVAYGSKELFSRYKEFNEKYELTFTDVCKVDSSDMSPGLWEEIGAEIVDAQNNPDIDGIVITHGTDTMAWTAQFLYLSLKNVSTPVVLTGSQLPPDEKDSDVYANLRDALIVASTSDIMEPVVVFAGNVYGAENLRKTKIWAFDAFSAINREKYGVLEGEGENRRLRMLRDDYIKGKPTVKSSFDNSLSRSVEIVSIWPGTDYSLIGQILEKLDGAVIIGFGAGNANKRFRPVAESVNIPLVMCTSGEGEVDILAYQAGKRFKQHVVSGGDWIPEYAALRLAYILGHKAVKNMDKKRIFEIFAQGIRIKDLEKYKKETGLNIQTVDRLPGMRFEDMLKII
ncbi:MAG: asparaginase [Thermoplasmata archaeon]